ncbi:Hypothetical protein R9X50_00436100 [Acrodontium crateriforme]|uniref:Zn(2)-C6 fungal-type domain-containing protein n=1 Tax=Acrodontium crateriforme TaxID=150365 RepID=A0AAQ3RAR0_9PEZI|nr:Hypothetical protein R9X50_00436100 [Acrodontium crateriforme]
MDQKAPVTAGQKATQPRRTHRKSRLGCVSCKQRRVKCDEAGPPCGQCRTRSMKCEYASSKRSQPLPRTLPTPATGVSHSIGGAPSEVRYTSPVNTTPRLPSVSTKRLELELMHQWCTVSYKSICGNIESHYNVWQNVVPQAGLKYDYLLNGIFAFSALEIAAFAEDQTGSKEYINRAMEYQNLAITQFRSEIVNASSDQHQALCLMSSILIALGLGMARFQAEYTNTVDTMILLFELISGGGAILMSKADALQNDPVFKDLTPWEGLTAQDMSPIVRSAMDRLVQLNDSRHGTTSSTPRESVLQAISHHTTCRKAIFYLEECFTRCIGPETRGYMLGWMNMVGREFIQAIEQKEVVALVVMMHYGALMEQQSYDLWWIQDVGRHLVNELITELDHEDDENVKAAIAWARENSVPVRPK